MRQPVAVEVRGSVFDSAMDAALHAEETGQEAILFAGKKVVVEKAEAMRLAEDGYAFAYLTLARFDDGDYRLETVPVS